MYSKKLNKERERDPKGLYFLFSVEAVERFQFYGMRALLALFLVNAIGYDETCSSRIFGWYTACVYLTALVGGIIADKYLGQRRSITIGAIIMSIGEFTLASYEIIPQEIALTAGLIFIVVGNGFFKPNISAMVGKLYENPNDERLDRAFSIFYMGINLGAFAGSLICGQIGQIVGWKYGFIVAGSVMLLGTAVYYFLQKKMLGNIGLKPVNKDKEKSEPLTKQDYDKIKSIGILTLFSVFFFTCFEQAGTSLTYFADDKTQLPQIFGFQLKSTFFQALNPMFILILTPLFTWIWKSVRKNPSIPGKFGLGLFIQGIGYIIMVAGASVYLENNAPVSMLYLTGCYFFCTVGELCVSPIGLSMIRKLAPVKYISLFFGVWFVSAFLGNLFAGYLASYYTRLKVTEFFSIPMLISIIFAILMWLLTKKTKTWMHGAE
jgi:POT family proton-dependent oligopeptide transporter